MRYVGTRRTWGVLLVVVALFSLAAIALAGQSTPSGAGSPAPGQQASPTAPAGNPAVGQPAAPSTPAGNPVSVQPAAPSASGTNPPPCVPAPEYVYWIMFGAISALLVVAFLYVWGGLMKDKAWKLGDAVSEEAANQPNPLPAGVPPVMVASSSRLIALLGLLVIMVLFLGFGYSILYELFNCQMNQVSTKTIMGFLFGGATMFAPYLANQLQTAFSSFAK